jgi:hypothetical protein
MALALVLALWFQPPQAPRAGGVAGQILTRDGVPAGAVRVAAIPAPPRDARPEDGSQYYTMPLPVRSVLTAADGRYRLANLPPGRYHVIAGLLGQATYFPSTLEWARATVITIGPGAADAQADIRLATPYGGRVRGRVNPPPIGGTGEIAVLSGVALEELLEVPVGADGVFEFGHVPRGSYLVSLFPTPPGMASFPFLVSDADVTPIALARRPLRTLSGRIVVRGGAPLPPAILAFTTARSHVSAALGPDGTFLARVQPERHLTDLGGLPVGYAVASVRLKGADVSKGILVGDADVDGVVITVAPPGAKGSGQSPHR